MRKTKEGEIPADMFALLTGEPNAEVGRGHANAMPAILTMTAVVPAITIAGRSGASCYTGRRKWYWNVALGDTRRREIN